MALSLVRRPPSGPSEPLSPARAALLRNSEAYEAKKIRLDEELARPAWVAEKAAERQAYLQARLDAIGEAEAAELTAWAAHAQGPMPTPHEAARAEVTAALAEATHNAAVTRRQAEAIEPIFRREEAELFEISKARPGLVRACLIEVAEGALQARHKAFEALADATAMLEGTLKALRDAKDDVGASAVMDIMRSGGRLQDIAWHDQNIVRCIPLRDAWSEMHKRLMDDANAQVDIDPAPASNAGTAA